LSYLCITPSLSPSLWGSADLPAIHANRSLKKSPFFRSPYDLVVLKVFFLLFAPIFFPFTCVLPVQDALPFGISYHVLSVLPTHAPVSGYGSFFLVDFPFRLCLPYFFHSSSFARSHILTAGLIRGRLLPFVMKGSFFLWELS